MTVPDGDTPQVAATGEVRVVDATGTDDAAIVMAWMAEFRAACLAASTSPDDDDAIRTVQFLVGAPAAAFRAAHARLAAASRLSRPPLTLVQTNEEEPQP